MLTFNEETHEYALNGKTLISVTQLLAKHGLAPDYSCVPESVLKSAAVKGTIIHEEIHQWIATGEDGFTSELLQVQEYCKANGFTPVSSETMVYNDIVAGTYDLLLSKDNKYYLRDFKTGMAVDRTTLAWQLSLYEYLLGIECENLAGLHLRGICKEIVVGRIPREEIERLLECERHNEKYIPNDIAIVPMNQELSTLGSLISQSLQLKKMLKELDDESEKIKEKLLVEMEKGDVKKIDNDYMTITRILPTTRTTLDTKKLQEEEPVIAQKYVKTTTVNGSVKIILKGGE